MPPKKVARKSPSDKTSSKKVVKSTKSPVKKVVKSTKSPVKKVVKSTKSPSKKVVKSTKSPVKKEVTTAKHLRDVIPKGVPKDISDTVGKFLHSEIREGAEKFYDDIIPTFINSYFISKDYFVEKIINWFLDNVGETFEDFLVKYQDEIKIEGSEVINNIAYLFDDIIKFKSTKTYGDPSVKNINDLIWDTMENLGSHEGYFKKSKDHIKMMNYLESFVDEE
jgi:hypothetical protein